MATDRRLRCQILWLFSGLLWMSVLVAEVRANDQKLNVLFIMADDLTGYIGPVSVSVAPNLARLARRGLSFTNAYCQQALCNPSRASLLTGKRPNTLRIWNNGTHFRELNPQVVTLPQYFKQHGYETRCVGKIFHNWHTRQKGDPISWSATEILHYANHGDDIPLVEGALPPNLALDMGRLYGKVPLCECRDVPDEAYYDGRVATAAIEVLEQIKDKPFFLAVGFWKPHAPFNAPKRYWDLHPVDEQRIGRGSPPPRNVPIIALHDSREILGIPPQQITPAPDQAAEMRRGYLANISYMDFQVGRLLDALERLGLDSKTVIVFVSDHGYHLGEHGLWGKTSCFDRDARVPLIIALPGKNSLGVPAEGLVELIDIFPTLIELGGLPPLEGLEGMSLVPMLHDPSLELKQAAFTQHPRPAYYDRSETGLPEAMGYSVVWKSSGHSIERYRYTEWRDWNTGEVLATEFYSYTSGPGERENLAGLNLPAMQAARQMLRRMFP